MSNAELDDYRVILFGWTWRQRDQDGLACFRPLPGQRVIHRLATRARLVDQPLKDHRQRADRLLQDGRHRAARTRWPRAPAARHAVTWRRRAARPLARRVGAGRGPWPARCPRPTGVHRSSVTRSAASSCRRSSPIARFTIAGIRCPARARILMAFWCAAVTMTAASAAASALHPSLSAPGAAQSGEPGPEPVSGGRCSCAPATAVARRRQRGCCGTGRKRGSKPRALASSPSRCTRLVAARP